MDHPDYVANHEAALARTVMLLSADSGPLVGLGLPQNFLREQLRSYLDSEFFSSLISLLEAVAQVDRFLHLTYQEAYPGRFISRERIINYLSHIRFGSDDSIDIPASFSNIYSLDHHFLFYLVLRGFSLEDVDYHNLFAQFNRFSGYLHNTGLFDSALMNTLNPDSYFLQDIPQVDGDSLACRGHSLFFDLASVNLEDIEDMQNVRLADQLFINASPRVLREFLEANDFYIIRELGDVPDDHVDRAREVIDHLFGDVNRVREVIDRLLGDNVRPFFTDWMRRGINSKVLDYFWNRFSQEDRMHIANTVLGDPNLMETILSNREFTGLTSFIDEHNLRTTLDDPNLTQLAHSSKRM